MKKKNIINSTIIVISSAVKKKNNIEFISAQKKKLPIYKRGDMLGHITSLTKIL